MLNIPNFAHGALFALGAYLLYTVIQVIGSFWLGLLLAPLVAHRATAGLRAANARRTAQPAGDGAAHNRVAR